MSIDMSKRVVWIEPRIYENEKVWVLHDSNSSIDYIFKTKFFAMLTNLYKCYTMKGRFKTHLWKRRGVNK